MKRSGSRSCSAALCAGEAGSDRMLDRRWCGSLVRIISLVAAGLLPRVSDAQQQLTTELPAAIPTALPNVAEQPTQVPLRYRGPEPNEGYFLPRDALSSAPVTVVPTAPSSTAPGEVHADRIRRDGTDAIGSFSRAPDAASPAMNWPPSAGPGAKPLLGESDPWAANAAESSPWWAAGPLGWLTTQRLAPLQSSEGETEFAFAAESVATLEPLGTTPPGIRPYKEGFFQKLSLTGTWLDRGTGANDFGETEVDLFATFALPAPSRDWPILLTPGFNFRMLDGPATADLPPRLYEAYFDLTWIPRWNARWTSIVGVAPGIYSDFETSDGAFRLTGKALARYDWTPDQLQLVFGVLYLDRYDITWLPAGGLIWMPDPSRKYEFLFPQPKLAQRIVCADRFEDWLYLGAEIGGNSYVTETVGAITLRGYRLYVGLERRLDGGAGFRLELGYVTGREIEFENSQTPIEASDTAMIRGGVTF